ncbi:MAG: stage III sporulation protein AF [Clostridia bacterium]|nr:stage III sporulation protein AF [Clostridia bacterium]
MKIYFTTILTISLVGGIITSLLPEKSNSLKKYVKYVIGLICAITLISPLTSVLGNITKLQSNINDFFDSNFSQKAIDTSNNLVLETGIEKVSIGIKSVLINKFKIDESNIDIDIISDDTDISAIKIAKIIIILKGNATWENSESIRNYLDGLISCDIEIKKM